MLIFLGLVYFVIIYIFSSVGVVGFFWRIFWRDHTLEKNQDGPKKPRAVCCHEKDCRKGGGHSRDLINLWFVYFLTNPSKVTWEKIKNIKQQKTRTGELKRVLPSFLFCCTVDVIFLPHFSKASVADRVSDPDPHKDMPPGSGCAWKDADPDFDTGDKKASKIYRFIRWIKGEE